MPLDVTSPPHAPLSRETLPWNSYVEVLQHHAGVQPNALAIAWLPRLTDVAAQHSYAQLDRRARAVAARLQALAAQGERALLVLENDLDYVAAFLGCAYAGTVAVTLHTPTQPKHLERLRHVAQDADARLILSSRAVAERFRARVDALEGMEHLTWLLVDEVDDAAAEGYAPFFPDPQDVAFLQYTSGSTGTPRGVVVQHAHLMYQGEYMQRLFGFTHRDRGLSWLPLFHDMGLILGMLQALYTGFPLYLSSPGAFVKSPGRWLRAISDLRISYTGGPDFCYDLCVDAVAPEDLAGVDLSCWEVALNAAEPVRARTLDRFSAAFGAYGFRPEAMNPGYGLAEGTLAVSVARRGERPVRRRVGAEALAHNRVQDDPGGRELVASGRMIADTVVRIVDGQGQALAPDRIGEIWVGGSGPAAGYWRQPEASEAVFAARLAGDPLPYLRTGDLGFLDGAGNLFVTGRLKDLIVVNGKNHHPNDLELTAEATSPALRPHFTAAFSVERDDREAVVVLAEVKAAEAAGLDAEALGHAIIRRVMAEHEIQVDEVCLLDQGQIPKTTSGKVQRAQCRELWLADGFRLQGRVRRGL